MKINVRKYLSLSSKIVLCYIFLINATKISDPIVLFQLIEKGIHEGYFNPKVQKESFLNSDIDCKKIYEDSCKKVYKLNYESFEYCLKYYENLVSYNNEKTALDDSLHPNIVRTFAFKYFENLQVGIMLMEYLSLEVDYKSIRQNKKEIVKILYDLMKALIYLYKKNIVHCDISCDNIRGHIVDNKVNYKIIDFDAALIIKDDHVHSYRRGSIFSMPPEAFYDLIIGHKTDIYCLGAVGFYLLNNDLGLNRCYYKLRTKYMNCDKNLDKKFHENGKRCCLKGVCSGCRKCSECKIEISTEKKHVLYCQNYIVNKCSNYSVRTAECFENSSKCQSCKKIECKKYQVNREQLKYEFVLCDDCKNCKDCKVCSQFKKLEKCKRSLYKDLLIRINDHKKKFVEDELLSFISTCFESYDTRPDIIELLNMENTKKMFLKYDLVYDIECL